MIARSTSPTPIALAQWKLKRKPEHTCVVGVLTRPSADDIAGEILVGKTNAYKDNWFDKLAINHLSKSVQAATGSLISLLYTSPYSTNSSQRKF